MMNWILIWSQYRANCLVTLPKSSNFLDTGIPCTFFIGHRWSQLLFMFYWHGFMTRVKFFKSLNESWQVRTNSKRILFPEMSQISLKICWIFWKIELQWFDHQMKSRKNVSNFFCFLAFFHCSEVKLIFGFVFARLNWSID